MGIMTIDIDALFKEAEKSIIRFEVPPPGFDPQTASDAALSHFGLPPRPNAVIQPGQSQRWRAMFAPPLSFRPLEYSLVKTALPDLPSVGARRGSIGNRGRRQRSLNWSGAYLTPRDGTAFDAIYGAWQVPYVQAPGGGTGPTFGSSTWIGFDGQRRYHQSSLPQAGTAQFLDAAVPDYFAWFQWWVRDGEGSGPPLRLSYPAVRPGDFMMVSMHVHPDRDRVKFLLRNASNGDVLAFDFKALPPFFPHKVSGATAEWVMERPSPWPKPVPYELPNYNTVEFDGCLAVASDPRGGPDVERWLETARLIDMFHVPDAPARTEKISSARLPHDKDEFRTVYG